MKQLYKQIGMQYHGVIYQIDSIMFAGIARQMLININGIQYKIPAENWYGRE